MANRVLEVGDSVRVGGFKTAGNIQDGEAGQYERDYIDGLFMRQGKIEAVDEDKFHPITVYFGEEANPTRCRFSQRELVAI